MEPKRESNNDADIAIEKALRESHATLYGSWTKWIGIILSIVIIVIGWSSFTAWERNEALARRVEEFLDKQGSRNERAYNRLTEDFTTRTERIERESIDRIKLGIGTLDARQSLNEARLAEIKSDVQSRVNEALSGFAPSYSLVVGSDTISDGQTFYLPRDEDYCTEDILVVNTGRGVARNVTLSLYLDSAYRAFDYSEGVDAASRDPRFPSKIGFGFKEDIRPAMYMESGTICFHLRPDVQPARRTVRGIFVINHDGPAVRFHVTFIVDHTRH